MTKHMFKRGLKVAGAMVIAAALSGCIVYPGYGYGPRYGYYPHPRYYY